MDANARRFDLSAIATLHGGDGLALPPDMVCEAVLLAEHFHRGQSRKNELPFITHPLAVWRTLQSAGVPDPHMQAAALLHDALEENPEHASDMVNTIAVKISPNVAQMVLQLSDDPAVPREARKAAQLTKIANAPRQVQLVKLADRLVNLTEPGLSPQRVQSYGLHTAQLLDCMAQIEPPRPMARGETRNNPSDSHNTCYWMQLAQQRLTHALRVQIKRIAAVGAACAMVGCALPATPIAPVQWENLNHSKPQMPSFIWDALQGGRNAATFQVINVACPDKCAV